MARKPLKKWISKSQKFKVVALIGKKSKNKKLNWGCFQLPLISNIVKQIISLKKCTKFNLFNPE